MSFTEQNILTTCPHSSFLVIGVCFCLGPSGLWLWPALKLIWSSLLRRPPHLHPRPPPVSSLGRLMVSRPVGDSKIHISKFDFNSVPQTYRLIIEELQFWIFIFTSNLYLLMYPRCSELSHHPCRHPHQRTGKHPRLVSPFCPATSNSSPNLIDSSS